jgi:inner membrane protein involved in colicin E2 resistance
MKLAAAAKAIVIALLALVLLVPVMMIQGLVAERQARSNEAHAGIADGWGKRQTVAGPYLAVPYERHWTEIRRETIDGKLREIRNERSESRVLRLPAAGIDWTADVEISEKARGIYKARLYTARLRAQGEIEVPARASFEDGTSRYKWGTPRLVLAVSDPLGIRAASGTHAFAPGPGDAAVAAGLHSVLTDFEFSRKIGFSIDLELGGSEALSLAPLNADTTVAMRANWPHPSFRDASCPLRTTSAPTASARAGKSLASPRKAPGTREFPFPSSSRSASTGSSSAPPSTGSSSSASPSARSWSSSCCAGWPSTRSSTPLSASRSRCFSCLSPRFPSISTLRRPTLRPRSPASA